MISQLKKRRQHGLSWRSIVVVSAGFAVFTLFFIFGFRNHDSSNRVNVVVATSPVTVWSWNTNDNTFIVLSIPSDDVIDALYGYGNYSLEALWRLGFIDKKSGLLLSDSLSDTLGLPITSYIGTKSQELLNVSDPLMYGRQLFSLSNVFSFMSAGYQSNMPMGLFVAFSRALGAARPDKIQSIDIGNLGAVSEESLPDGTIRNILSPDFLDHTLGNVFENDAFRAEDLSVALYNTTDVPAVGNRAARLLTNAGILVVTVGNDQKPLNRCELIGSATPLSSKTAAYIISVFNCKKIVSQESARADLIVRLGNDFAKRFETSKN